VSQIEFDSETTRRLEAVYQTADMLRRRRFVREALAARSGERILDVGCGPGFYVAELLDEVGTQGSVVGLDGSEDMLAAAARRCEGHANVAFHQADATSLPVKDSDFDAAVCVQVLEYVPDTAAALREMHRALRPGGRVVVWDIDWATASWYSSDPDRMARAMRAWDLHLTHPSLPQRLVPRLREAGFEGVTAKGHVFSTTELSGDTFGGALFPMIERYIAGTDEFGPDEAAAWGDEQRELGERGEFFFSVTQFCVSGRKPA
jgi:arsenite methyltransferase